MASSSSSEPPQPGPWFILRSVALVGRDTRAVKDPAELSLALPLEEPLSVCTLTALTGLSRKRGRKPTRGVNKHGHELPRIVTITMDHLLLHVSGSPSGFNLDPDREGVFFLAHGDELFEPHVDAAGRNVFKGSAVRLPRRNPGLSRFSGTKNVGLLRLPENAFVVAELQATDRSDPTTVPFITYSPEKGWEEHDLAWTIVDDEANPQWITHDVIAHDHKLWWVNLLRGLLVCNPVPDQDLHPTLGFVQLPVLPGLENRHEPPDQIDSYRMVKLSAHKVRFVDVARGRDEPQGETRVAVWTLDGSPSATADASWEDRPWTTSLAKIWESDNYVRSGMPTEVPVVALVHPSKPAVVYFFLEQYVFAVDVNEGAVEEFAVIPGQVALPRPISQHDVLAWERTPFRLGKVSEQSLKRKESVEAELDGIKGVAPAEGDQQPLAPSPES